MYEYKRLKPLWLLACFLILSACSMPSHAQGQDVVAKDVMALDLSAQSFGDLVRMLQSLNKNVETPENGEALIRVYKEVAKRYSRAHEKSYVISGVVTDDANNPLDGVAITCSKYEYQAMMGEEPKPERFTIVAGETFEIETGRTYRIHLKFSKDGYYSEEKYFNAPSPKILMQQLEAGLPIELPNVVVNDVRIVLVKKGEYATLARRRETLHYSSEGLASVLKMVPPSAAPVVESIRDANDKESHPALTIMIIPESENGVIPSELRMLQGPRKQQVLLPTKAKMIVTDPDGGLIHFIPDGSERPIWLQMKRSPDDGYVAQWQMDADLLSTWPYFYIKIGNLYGRGRVMPLKVVDNTTFEYQMIIQMQPNGTTNLESEGLW